MSRICPRPCSRLVTAAVYLSVGIVQLIMGVILLRSKYVYLLAGPDFWTSCSNIAAGSVLGVSASVWKNSTKYLSKKHRTRRNLLLALYFAALIINGTTLGILLMGEGNTLLSIRLEKHKANPTYTFAKEIMAYAYATSVCSPIFCIVVSIVGISGTIFQSPKSKCMAYGSPDSSIIKERTQSYQWVFTPDSLSLKKPCKQVSFSESPEDPLHARPRYISTTEHLQRAMRRMSLGQVSNSLTDSTMMLQQHHRQQKINNQHNPDFPPPLHRGDAAPRSEATEHLHREKGAVPTVVRQSERPSGRSSYGSSGYVTMDKYSQVPLSTLDEVFDSQSEEVPRHIAAQFRKLKDHPHRSSPLEIDPVAMVRYRNYLKHCFMETAMHHQLPRVRGQTDLSLELQRLERQYDAIVSGKKCGSPYEVLSNDSLTPQTSPEGFSPYGSDVTDSFERSRASPFAGDVVPIDVQRQAKSPRGLIPVLPPLAPQRQGSVLSSANKVQHQATEDRGESCSLASFREVKNTPDREQEYPRVGPTSVERCGMARMIPMKSISEDPDEGPSSSKLPQNPSTTEDSSTSSGESSNQESHRRPEEASGSRLSVNFYQERDSPGKFRTPKRRGTLSCRRIKEIWSSAGTESAIDISDKIVDADSLIGLSEQELMDRQSRTRSIRQVVQQRLKEQENVF